MSSKEKSSVIVQLHNLVLTGRKDDRFGKVVKTRSLNEDDLVKIAVSRKTEISASTMKAVFEKLKHIAIEQIANGASVRFGLGYFSLSVNGVFIGDDARWDPAKHRLNVIVTPVAELREAVQATSVEVRGRSVSGPTISSLLDVSTGEINSRITPGGGVNLRGSRIRIQGTEKGVGISLINQSDGEVIPISSNAVALNNPSFINFVVPVNLPAGVYKLSLRTQYSSSHHILKEPRTAPFEYLLNVE